MTLTKYDITLSRLTEDKIELVRHWRNDPKISRYMEFRELITVEMQKAWFQRINNPQNYYFILIFEGKEIGLANIRDIDAEHQSGEGGLFIYADEYLNSEVPFRAVLALNDFCFETLQLQEMIAHIMKDNPRALEFNVALGYVAENAEDSSPKPKYRLTKEIYFKHRERIARFLGLPKS
jgi:UDP-4-amino-4,6-dideoxy-N-acetyl-beta-L-altrosamine N-acetyltransferase